MSVKDSEISPQTRVTLQLLTEKAVILGIKSTMTSQFITVYLCMSRAVLMQLV